jgi:hypothetical protein
VVVHPDADRRDELAAALQAVYGTGDVIYHDDPSAQADTAGITTATRDDLLNIPTLLRTLPGDSPSVVIGRTNPRNKVYWWPPTDGEST